MWCFVVLVGTLIASERSDQVDALAQPFVESGSVIGLTVGYLTPDETYVRGFGRVANDREDRPDGDTIYEIGSISKVFTALLAAEGARIGELSIDDSVNDHLPEEGRLDDIDPDDPVRLLHLSNHTSGFPRMPPNFAPRDPNDPFADYDAERLFDVLPRLSLSDTPGESYQYSNLAAGLLGAIATWRSPVTSYEELLRERICEPLEMKDTLLTIDDARRSRCAEPHDVDGRVAFMWDFDVLAGAGAIRSTVNDLLIFERRQLALADGPLDEAMRVTQQKTHDLPGGGGVALGWHIAPDGVLWHNGQTGGYHSLIAIDHESRCGAVVLSTGALPAIDALGFGILKSLKGESVEPIPLRAAVRVDVADLLPCIGIYRNVDTPIVKLEVTKQGDSLEAQITGQPSWRLHPLSTRRFFYRVVPAEIEFHFNDSGDATDAVLFQGGREIRWERVTEG